MLPTTVQSDMGIAMDEIPGVLRPLTQILQRAEEVKDTDPFMSYQCQLCAANIAYGLLAQHAEQEGEAFLVRLLDELERTKASLREHPAMADDKAAAGHILHYSLRVLMAADEEDRLGTALRYQRLDGDRRKTAKLFLAAATFFEVLKLYGPLPDEIQEKIKYCKWRAAELLKKEANLPSYSGQYPSSSAISGDISSSGEGSGDNNVTSPVSSPEEITAVDIVKQVDRTQALAQAEKASRQATSAIMFEDIDAAIACLQRALDILLPHAQ